MGGRTRPGGHASLSARGGLTDSLRMSASLSRLQSSWLGGYTICAPGRLAAWLGCRRTRLVLLFEVGAEPPHDGIRGEVELSFGRPRCRLTAGTAAEIGRAH